MPDWSYHPLKKLLLNKMSAKTSREFIHASMSTIASIPGGRSLIGFLGHMTPPQELHKNIHQTTFPSPLGLSGHIDPKLSGIKAFQELGFGFLEIGPIVLEETHKQMEPKSNNQHILFSNHQEKVPLKLAIKKLNRSNIQIPIFARIDPHVKINEWELIMQHLTPFVDAFIGTSEQISLYIQNNELYSGRTFYVSISADEMTNKLEIEKLTQRAEIGGIVVTAPRQAIDDNWHEDIRANECLTKAVKQIKELHPDLIIITSGGVETPGEAYSLVRAGADLLMLTDGYVRAGPGLPKRIHERLVFEEVPNHNQQWYWSFLFGLSILIGGMIALYFALTSNHLSA